MRAGPRLAVALLVLAALTLSGCQYLFGYPGPLEPPLPPGASPFPVSSEPVTSVLYTSGSATITIGGTVVKLDRLLEPTVSYSGYDGAGTMTTWTDGNGWFARVMAMPSVLVDPLGDSGAFVSLDRISAGQHWTTVEPDKCKLTIEKSNASGLSGSASCTGLRWTDAMAGFGPGPDSGYVTGEPAFDAKITFAAAP